MTILTISGSPSADSRSTFLVATLASRLHDLGIDTRSLDVRDIPAHDLLHARFDSPAIVDFVNQVQRADAVIIGTPIYKAAYSGVLKALLDLLPQTAFHDKLILPVATGGSAAHFLAVDYALKPVLSALGARHILSTVFATEAQLVRNANKGYVFADEVRVRLEDAIDQLAQGVASRERRVSVTQAGALTERRQALAAGGA
ncbi:NADPH-dependent FMN reductase [Pigmentiphaga litoralis]|uniref:NADPH-dependent FMN reductase n=1 Tax=Pigmentiphaga litoralis TaxID=516702 RepID=UPI003B438427